MVATVALEVKPQMCCCSVAPIHFYRNSSYTRWFTPHRGDKHLWAYPIVQLCELLPFSIRCGSDIETPYSNLCAVLHFESDGCTSTSVVLQEVRIVARGGSTAVSCASCTLSLVLLVSALGACPWFGEWFGLGPATKESIREPRSFSKSMVAGTDCLRHCYHLVHLV